MVHELQDAMGLAWSAMPRIAGCVPYRHESTGSNECLLYACDRMTLQGGKTCPN